MLVLLLVVVALIVTGDVITAMGVLGAAGQASIHNGRLACAATSNPSRTTISASATP